MVHSAIISDCGKYRYQLQRKWSNRSPKAMFLMLNPSTACSETNDLTTIRCINFAKKWGFGSICIGNLYPFRAKRPKNLKKWLNSDEFSLNIKVRNGMHIRNMVETAEIVVCAWGNHQGQPPFWVQEFGGNKLCYLELCKDSTPKHPLGNLSKDLVPLKYKLNTIANG